MKLAITSLRLALEELNVNAMITIQRSGRPRGRPILIEAILKAPKIAMLMISLTRDLMVSAEDECGRAPVDHACHKKSLVKLSHLLSADVRTGI